MSNQMIDEANKVIVQVLNEYEHDAPYGRKTYIDPDKLPVSKDLLEMVSFLEISDNTLALEKNAQERIKAYLESITECTEDDPGKVTFTSYTGYTGERNQSAYVWCMHMFEKELEGLEILKRNECLWTTIILPFLYKMNKYRSPYREIKEVVKNCLEKYPVLKQRSKKKSIEKLCENWKSTQMKTDEEEREEGMRNRFFGIITQMDESAESKFRRTQWDEVLTAYYGGISVLQDIYKEGTNERKRRREI